MPRNRDREQFDAIVAGLREDDPRFVRKVERARWRYWWRWAEPVLIGLVSLVLVLSFGHHVLAAAVATGATVTVLGLASAVGRYGWPRRRRDRPG